MAIETVVTYPYSGTLVVLECCRCGADFGMPRGLYDQANSDRDVWFWCPNGHKQHFTRTREQWLAEELAAAQRANAQNREALAIACKSRSSFRGVVTRERNRLARWRAQAAEIKALSAEVARLRAALAEVRCGSHQDGRFTSAFEPCPVIVITGVRWRCSVARAALEARDASSP